MYIDYPVRKVKRLRTVPTNTEVFLCGLCLCGKIRSKQGLLESKKTIGGNQAFFRDNLAIISLKNAKI